MSDKVVKNRDRGDQMGKLNEKVEALLEWATENNIQTDPERISKLYDEARRRWAHLMSGEGISEIVEETLRKME